MYHHWPGNTGCTSTCAGPERWRTDWCRCGRSDSARSCLMWSPVTAAERQTGEKGLEKDGLTSNKKIKNTKDMFMNFSSVMPQFFGLHFLSPSHDPFKTIFYLYLSRWLNSTLFPFLWVWLEKKKPKHNCSSFLLFFLVSWLPLKHQSHPKFLHLFLRTKSVYPRVHLKATTEVLGLLSFSAIY